jgi:prefoldin subunit 5
MLKVYALIIVMGILAGVGYGAKYYYDTTQNTISTLRDNNAQLEIAAETAQQSVDTLRADMKKLGEINNQLQASLQKAEAYGDELRSKLSKLNLVVEALKDSKVLEGKMNGASVKLWRGIMGDTGGNADLPTPSWLQRVPAGAGDQNGNQSGKGTDTNSSSTEASPAQ